MSGKSWEQKLIIFWNVSDVAKGIYCGCTWCYEHLYIAEYTFLTKVGQEIVNIFKENDCNKLMSSENLTSSYIFPEKC